MAAIDLFGKAGSESFVRYTVQIQVADKLIGGIPKDPDTIRKWLSARMELGDRELIELARETVVEMQEATGERPKADDVLAAVAAASASGNGFKSIDGHLVYEGRCMKAALKEAANVAYPGVAWPGKPAQMKKGLKSRLAETVFVEDQYIDLGVDRPSGTEQRIKHIQVPGKGKQSAINVVDYVERPTLSFVVAVLDDFLPNEAWLRIWQCAEEIGIGADRARSDGRFELIAWDRV